MKFYVLCSFVSNVAMNTFQGFSFFFLNINSFCAERNTKLWLLVMAALNFVCHSDLLYSASLTLFFSLVWYPSQLFYFILAGYLCSFIWGKTGVQHLWLKCHASCKQLFPNNVFQNFVFLELGDLLPTLPIQFLSFSLCP